jgi:serine/threonine-protein kinase
MIDTSHGSLTPPETKVFPMKDPSAAAESALADLVSLWQRHRAEGQPAAPAELCRACPELLPELQRRIAALERMADLVDGKQGTITLDTAGPEQTTPTPTGWPEILGYEIVGELGRSGMGVVYLARDTQLNRLAALKMVLCGAHPSEQSRGRFRVEAEAVARLQHPHVVQVFSWGEHDGLPYLVMEYVAGGGLDRRIAGRPQPPADAARLVMLLARAVQAAHKAGVVHRDLKPANVLLAPATDEPALNTAYGWPKVSDFGLARLSGERGAQTASFDVLGTPSYMAPEQAAGKVREVGPPADIYALGAIL